MQENTSGSNARTLANQMLEKIGLKRTDAYKMWYDQQRHANDRGIPFNIDLDHWVLWWGLDLKKRGRGKGKLQMCRINDTGPYCTSNIYKDTCENNSADKVKHGTFKTKEPTLTEEDVEIIESMLSAMVPQREIARTMGTSQRTVTRINRGEYRPYDKD